MSKRTSAQQSLLNKLSQVTPLLRAQLLEKFSGLLPQVLVTTSCLQTKQLTLPDLQLLPMRNHLRSSQLPLIHSKQFKPHLLLEFETYSLM
jgi:hypothetical protein